MAFPELDVMWLKQHAASVGQPITHLQAHPTALTIQGTG